MDADRVQDVLSPDGRVLRLLDTGPVGAPAVLAHHGTPGAGLLQRLERESARRLGLRLVAYDRPGYAGSSPQTGRSVGDAASDVASILDALGIDRFATYGTSGGGPHALACAALLPDRCVAAATIAGVAPGDGDGLDWSAGMGEGNVEEFGVASQGRDALLAFCASQAQGVTEATAEELAVEMEPYLSPVDAAAMTGELAEFFMAEEIAALEPGVEGWVDDDLAFLAPWGFDLAAMTVPTQIWQGEQDLMVPASHGRWLASHVAGAQWQPRPADGHITLFTNNIASVHGWLAEQVR